MKKIIPFLLVLAMLFACTVPAMADDMINAVGTVIGADKNEDFDYIAVWKRGTYVIPQGITIHVSRTLIVRDGTLLVQGNLSGTVSDFTTNNESEIIVSGTGSVSLMFSRRGDAEKFASAVVTDHSYVSVDGCFVKVYPCLHEHTSKQTVNATVCERCGEVLSYEASNTASMLSIGYPEIVFAIGCLAVGFVAAMLIFRKKKAAVSSPAAAEQESPPSREA